MYTYRIHKPYRICLHEARTTRCRVCIRFIRMCDKNRKEMWACEFNCMYLYIVYCTVSLGSMYVHTQVCTCRCSMQTKTHTRTLAHIRAHTGDYKWKQIRFDISFQIYIISYTAGCRCTMHVNNTRAMNDSQTFTCAQMCVCGNVCVCVFVCAVWCMNSVCIVCGEWFLEIGLSFLKYVTTIFPVNQPKFILRHLIFSLFAAVIPAYLIDFIFPGDYIAEYNN